MDKKFEGGFCMQSVRLLCYVIAGNLEQPTVMAFRIEDKSLWTVSPELWHAGFSATW